MAPSSDSNPLSNSLNEFSWELYRKLGGDPGTNIFFSPYNIMAALAMTFAGAKNNTAQQISDVLNLGSIENVHESFQKLNKALFSQNEPYTVRSANRLYAQKGFNILEAFVKITEEHYRAGIISVDFKKTVEKTRSLINGWVAEQTDGKIQDLIASNVLDPFTVLLLINAVYFKGKWSNQFDPSHTSVQDFFISPSESISVNMMYKEDNFEFFRDQKCQVLMLPYVGDSLRMTIALPNPSMSIADLEANTNAHTIAAWSKECREEKVEVRLPRFNLETSFELNDPLGKMGIKDLFYVDRADLSGISASDGLYMSKVIHKAFLAVNEEGTEATASTAAVVASNSGTLIFKADRPFLFIISDHSSGAILFMGRLVRPADERPGKEKS